MKLYNSLTRQIEDFKPIKHPIITFYSCGPTVYDYTHIGHLRTYINNDILKRTLIYFGFKVKHVMNITDVGHLTGDNDSGEDKLEKGAKKSGKTVWEVAQFFTDYFQKTTAAVNVLPVDHLVKATDHIDDMISLIQKIESKGYTYKTEEAIYFDVSKFVSYGKLSHQKIEDKRIGSREEVYVDPKKKNPADFALWFRRVGRFKNHVMHWKSPWGDGFPGWHIECSAMSMKYLGETIDIHSGGIDHIPVHHENEIAQSEAANNKQFVRFWVHNQFLLVQGKKMSKSLGNFITLDDLTEKKIHPLALRYLFLQTHYRQIQNFTWEAIGSAQQTIDKLFDTVKQLQQQSDQAALGAETSEKITEFKNQFAAALSADLQLPQAVSIMWAGLKSDLPSVDKLNLLYSFDAVLGLKLREIKLEEPIPDEIKKMVAKRDRARDQLDFNQSDKIRTEIENLGYEVKDTKAGTIIKKKN